MWIASLLHGLARRSSRGSQGVSAEYKVIPPGEADGGLDGWREPCVAEAQHAEFSPLLQEMRQGRLRQDFASLVKSVRLCGGENPRLLEVGCGSGWNAEVLHRHLDKPLRYLGMDYSPAMTRVGRREYPGTRFLIGDATALPLADRCCDIVLLGGVLMHLLHYKRAIAEARRVSCGWVILHTMPVMQRRETTLMTKLAYGKPTAEVTFNESSLLQLVTDNGLELRHTLPNVEYDLESELGEKTVVKTYLCEVSS
jgi:SAM-dependent methyltransferase